MTVGYNNGGQINVRENLQLTLATNDSSRWIIESAGHFVPAVDTSFDIGDDALKVKDIYQEGIYTNYNTFTDTSNYERGVIKWDSNVLTIRTESAGTGVDRELEIAGKTLNVNSRNSNRAFFKYIDTTYWNLTTTKFSSVGNLDLGDSSTGRIGTLYGQDIDIESTANLPVIIRNPATKADGINTGIAFQYEGSDFGAGIKSVLRGGTANSNKYLEFYTGGDSSTPKFVVTGDNLVYQRNGTNAQKFEFYSTYTDDSNYARGFFEATASNYVKFGSEAAGTGTPAVVSLIQDGDERIRISSTFISAFKTIVPISGASGVDLGRNTIPFEKVFCDKLVTLTTTVTATSYNQQYSDSILLVDDDTAGSTVTINLLLASLAHDGSTLKIKKLGTTANVIIDGSGAQTIDGAATFTLTTQYESVTIVSDGTNWFII